MIYSMQQYANRCTAGGRRQDYVHKLNKLNKRKFNKKNKGRLCNKSKKTKKYPKIVFIVRIKFGRNGQSLFFLLVKKYPK